MIFRHAVYTAAAVVFGISKHCATLLSVSLIGFDDDITKTGLEKVVSFVLRYSTKVRVWRLTSFARVVFES